MRIWRLAAALLVLTVGGIHLWLYFDYFRAVHVVGVLFLLNAAAAVAVAAALLVVDAQWPLAAGLAFSAGTLAAFVISVYHGLFGYVEKLTGAWQEAAAAVEIAAIVVLALAAVQARGMTRRSEKATVSFGSGGRG